MPSGPNLSVLTAPAARALGQRIRQFGRHQLERRGDIHASPAGGGEGQDGFAECIRLGQDGLVAQVVAELASERRVQQRRLRLGDGIADDGVEISHMMSRRDNRDYKTDGQRCAARRPTGRRRGSDRPGTARRSRKNPASFRRRGLVP